LTRHRDALDVEAGDLVRVEVEQVFARTDGERDT